MRFARPALSRRRRQLDRAANIADLRAISKSRLPGGVFDYIDGAAEDERTMHRNHAAYGAWLFRPRVLRDVSEVRISTTLLGREIAAPLVLAPTGFSRIADPDGEFAVARAAARAGLPYALSSLATRSIEEVAAVSTGPKWFQVYVWRDRGLVEEMVRRSAEAGYEAICLTVDFATLGRRERDVRRGFTLPPKLGLQTLLEGLRHPGWSWRFARSEPILFANVTGSDALDGTDAVALSEYVAEQLDPTVSWDDVEWFRSIWDGPIVVKGIQDLDDALRARELGIEAIALSNHGGRQLDSAPAPVELLPEVVDAVGDDIEVICDGGIRRGSDVVKAVALGATACMAGRAYLYGLGAGGEAGVDKALGVLTDEVHRTMALTGVTRVKDLGSEHLRPSGP